MREMTRRKRGTWVIGGAETKMKEAEGATTGRICGSGCAELKNQLRINKFKLANRI